RVRHAGQARPRHLPGDALGGGPAQRHRADVLRHHTARRLAVLGRPAARPAPGAGQGLRHGLHLLHPPRGGVLPRQGPAHRRHPAHATFRPKPFTELAGSALHTHLSLFEGDRNAFHDPADPIRLSTTAKQFIAGLLTHAREYTAITNQTVNSYRRLLAGTEAPT